MTVIAAISTDDGLFLGYNEGSELSGSPVSGGYVPWIFFGEWALGITGQSSVQRVLLSKLEDIDQANADPYQVIGSIESILISNFIGMKADDDIVNSYGIFGILAHKKGFVWDVSDCLSLAGIPKGDLWARGSGSEYCLGAHRGILKTQGKIVEDHLKICVEVAIESDIYCVGIPTVVKL
jgi:ATP-dependent protease HslVU (ClpYQ) peptidase subunit